VQPPAITPLEVSPHPLRVSLNGAPLPWVHQLHLTFHENGDWTVVVNGQTYGPSDPIEVWDRRGLVLRGGEEP
jgi:hypothetical protein